MKGPIPESGRVKNDRVYIVIFAIYMLIMFILLIVINTQKNTT